MKVDAADKPCLHTSPLVWIVSAVTATSLAVVVALSVPEPQEPTANARLSGAPSAGESGIPQSAHSHPPRPADAGVEPDPSINSLGLLTP
jgi:hypothetical protein